MGTRDIDSTPPPIVRSDWPDITCAAAVLTASSPDAQKRLSCLPGTDLIESRDECGDARDIGALFADRRHATQHDVVDRARIERVAVAERRAASAPRAGSA